MLNVEDGIVVESCRYRLVPRLAIACSYHPFPLCGPFEPVISIGCTHIYSINATYVSLKDLDGQRTNEVFLHL